jgi:hypothetical protein
MRGAKRRRGRSAGRPTEGSPGQPAGPRGKPSSRGSGDDFALNPVPLVSRGHRPVTGGGRWAERPVTLTASPSCRSAEMARTAVVRPARVAVGTLNARGRLFRAAVRGGNRTSPGISVRAPEWRTALVPATELGPFRAREPRRPWCWRRVRVSEADVLFRCGLDALHDVHEPGTDGCARPEMRFVPGGRSSPA